MIELNMNLPVGWVREPGHPGTWMRRTLNGSFVRLIAQKGIGDYYSKGKDGNPWLGVAIGRKGETRAGAWRWALTSETPTVAKALIRARNLAYQFGGGWSADEQLV